MIATLVERVVVAPVAVCGVGGVADHVDPGDDAGVEIRMFGKLGKGASGIDAYKLPNRRLHVRAIVRDGKAAFLGSQSLRKLELDGRREVGVIIKDASVAKKMQAVFEADWALIPDAKQAGAGSEKEKEKEKEGEKEDATSDA